MAYSTPSSHPTKSSASINFWKYQGAGNDFILVERPIHTINIPHLYNRHYGIGSDGVIVLEPSSLADIKMRFFNPDGSEAGFCGNGLRSAIRHLGLPSSTVETKSGICHGEIHDNLIRATFPKVEILGEGLVFTGTRHYVAFVNDFSRFEKEAPLLRKEHSANVNFALIRAEETFIRTYEMGVEGETLACGSGAAAVAVLLKKPTTIVHASQHKTHFWSDAQGKFWMEGCAEFVFAGNIPLR